VAKVRFLSQEWLDLHALLAADLPARPGATARIVHVVTGAPDGEVRYVQGIVDGRLEESALGDDPAVQLSITQKYADARQVAEGQLDDVAAFMQGRAKVVGDMGTVMALMPFLTSDERRAALAQVTSQTEY
jgi:hypothetical protein